MSFSSFDLPGNIRKAARAIENEDRATVDFSRNAREALFQEALERGDLYDEAVETAERRGVDFDDISEGRVDPQAYLSTSDYPDYLPSPQGLDVDPDREVYTGYRLAQQNPEIRSFLSQPNVNLYPEGQRAVGQRFLENYRFLDDSSQNLINPRDFEYLRDSFSSDLIEPDSGDLPSERQFDTADFVEREGTRGYSRGLNRDIYPGFNELVNKVGYLDSLLNSRQIIEEQEGPGSYLRRQIVNARTPENSPDQLNLINQEAESLNELENRLRPSTPEQLNDPDYVRSRNMDIRGIGDEINDIRYGSSNSRGLTDVTILNQMLPSVRETLGERGALEAAQQQERTIRGDRNLARQNQRFAADLSPSANLRNYRRLPLSEQQRFRSVDLTSPEERELINPSSSDFINITAGDQLAVPGLGEELRTIKTEQLKQRPTEARARFEQVLDKYPEVRDLLSKEVKPGRALPIKGEEFEPYLKYADQEQMFSTPEIRKELYDNVLLDVEPELRPSLSQRLYFVERQYTSGNPVAQQKARQEIEELAGKQNVVALNEKRAFRPNRPVIGGGGYLGLGETETREKFAFIDKRAADVNNVLNEIYAEIPSDKLTAIYPGLKTTLIAAMAPVGFLLDDETGQVTRTLPSDNTYNIKVSKTGANRFSLASSNSIPNKEKASSNLVDFLVANPATSPVGIVFDTSKPGEGRDVRAQGDVPAPIAQAWEEEIKQQSFANLRPNTLVYNNPLGSIDLYESRLNEGVTEEQSSTIRKLKPFVEADQDLPSLRAVSYSRAGFGPATVSEFGGTARTQLAFVTPQGKVIALQANPPEAALKGKVDVSPDKVKVTQSTLPFSSTPRYFSGDPVTGAALGALQMGQDINSRSKELTEWWNKGRDTRVPNESNASWGELLRDDRNQLTRTDAAFEAGETGLKGFRPLKAFTPRMIQTGPTPAVRQAFERPVRAVSRTPASLLPGLADLIPSPEAIQTGYRQGPAAMGKQMGREFVQSLPTGAAFASVLSTPALAPFAPGVGLGFVGSAAANAANEVVRQETGEGIVPKVRQFIGTAPRTNVAGKPRMAEAPLTAEIKPLSAQGKAEMNRRQNRNELQRRLDLVKERFNPRKGEFSLSEFIFGR